MTSCSSRRRRNPGQANRRGSFPQQCHCWEWAKVKILGAQQTRAYDLAEDHWLRSSQLGGDRHRPIESRLGSRLRACTLSGQQGETAIAVEVQGRMIRIAKPIPVRTA